MKTLKITISCLALATLISISPLFVKKAEAQWFVVDVVSQAKEWGLDTVASIAAHELLERVTNDTVNWINTGFEGSPAFVTDPGQYFGNLADGIAGQLIYNNPDMAFMCGPLRARVQIALTSTYGGNRSGRFQCTLTQIGDNFENFMGDFNQGGWNGFIEMTQNSQNNPIGLYNTWNDSVLNQINTAITTKEKDLDRGSGFLSYEKCEDIDAAGFNKCRADGGSIAACNYSFRKCETSTPGAVINGQLNKVLGSGTARVEAADELNEVIAALINQLIQKSLGATGLR